ncbi:MAG: hypothetical protein NT150_12310 [Bacteroidetes bacterium]|nr:hypothetical protein [Bacteroidota bacterium]
MRYCLAIALVVSFFSNGYTQDTATISLPIKEGYKKWTKTELAGRFGVGLQKEFYTEFGVSFLKFYYNNKISSSLNYYGAIEWSQPKNIYGYKVGCEINANSLALGLEAKYQMDKTNFDFVLTPKIGFGVLGIINVFYGYNISMLGQPFSEIGHHQFSIVFNLNKKMFSRNTSKANQRSPALPNP